MGLRYEDLEELCETVGKKLKEANDKIRMSNGDLSGGDLEYVDKLTHALKSIKTTMAMMDAEDGHSGRMYDERDYSGRDYSGRGYSRYSRRGYMPRYSGDNSEMVEQLRNLMEDAPDDRTRMEFKKFITKVESM